MSKSKHDLYVLTLVAEVSLKDGSIMGTFRFGPGPFEIEKVKKEDRNEKLASGKKVVNRAQGKSKKPTLSK